MGLRSRTGKPSPRMGPCWSVMTGPGVGSPAAVDTPRNRREGDCGEDSRTRVPRKRLPRRLRRPQPQRGLRSRISTTCDPEGSRVLELVAASRRFPSSPRVALRQRRRSPAGVAFRSSHFQKYFFYMTYS